MEDKLQALSRSRDREKPSPNNKPTRRWRQTAVAGIPWILAVIAVLLVLILFGERMLPATSVVVEPVVTLPETKGGNPTGGAVLETRTGNPYAGTALFQASGWIEADPYPHRATALAGGIVDRVHVLEGQSVRAGDPIATLIDDDSELRLNMAEANLSAAKAALDAAASEQELAHARIESMQQQIEVAEARRQELSDLAIRAEDLGPEVLAEQEIIQAGLRLRTQEQTVEALKAQVLERELEAQRLGGQLRVRSSLLAEAQVRLREAQLEFDRMIVRAPVDGIIQRLMVAPGQKKVLMADNPESATVAILFQPEKLQARIDVPIAEAARLSPGQAVLVESEFLGGVELKGHIQRIVGEADLQRNTLQVKVRIDNPPAGLRPEILCRARFLDTRVTDSSIQSGPEGVVESGTGGARGLSVLVPTLALYDGSGPEPFVWVVDESGRRTERRQVRLAGEERDGYALVREGLRPGDRVVVKTSSELREGSRIQY
ncbi:HlyD family efflux transporter periplasmic adaptor subunit [Puniceicoccales bacterium CK1056]|uniref:HlyD family efflux transporter periplasmic adaptor subunit n=1 Tax=Oceanipulchritudo coccoides TaxID=2706888 RepID=A0A6B2M1V6_9BACT|nr:HlyD family efflux transporter periplasmic adaptor subunit [Oceanipulchritudo coccoides]NDV62918.1 HlyD family efflux transporter periplasmic adaptor subunit [Oceanipulchritudo coccoides]